MKIYRIVIGTIVGILIVIAIPVIYISIGVLRDVRQSNRERVQLLYETDHKSLLAGCRFVIANRRTFSCDRHWIGSESSTESFIDPKDNHLPAVIRQLNPSYIIAQDDQMTVELHGGFDHYGVMAYSEAAQAEKDNQSGNSIQLLPSLQYYDEGLHYHRESHIKKLKKMRPDTATQPAWSKRY